MHHRRARAPAARPAAAARTFRRRGAVAAFLFFTTLLLVPGPVGSSAGRAAGAGDAGRRLDADGNGVEDLLDAWRSGVATWERLRAAATAATEADAPVPAARARPEPASGPVAAGRLRVLRLGGDAAGLAAARAGAEARGGRIEVLHRLDRFGGVEVLAVDEPGLGALLAAPAGGRLLLDRDGTPALDRSSVLAGATLARSGPWRLEGDWTASVAILDSGCDTAHDDLGDYSRDNNDGPPPRVGDALDWSDAAVGWPVFLEYKVIGWHDVTDDFPLAAGPWDYHWHGTALAGVVAGQGQVDTRWRGIAPSARLTVVKFYDFDGVWRQWAGDFLAACAWLLDHRETYRVRVALCAVNWDADLGFGPVVAELLAAGVLPVCAAGNGGPGAGEVWPAALPGVVTVGATDDAGRVAAYSGRGSAGSGKPDLVAPGGGLLPASGRITATDSEPDDSYSGRQGTSLAAAHVAAGALCVLEALRKEGCPAPADAAQARLAAALLRGTAAPVAAMESADGLGEVALAAWETVPDSVRGWGLLQIAAAAEAAVSPLAIGEAAIDSLGGAGGRRTLARRLALVPGRQYRLDATPTGTLDVALEVHETRALLEEGAGLPRLLCDDAGPGGDERTLLRAPAAGDFAFVAVKLLAGIGRVTLTLSEPAAAPAGGYTVTMPGPLQGWGVPARLGSGRAPTLVVSGLTDVDPRARLVHALEQTGRERSGWPVVIFPATTLQGALTSPLAWDLDGTPGDEIVVGSAYGIAYFLTAAGGVTPVTVAPANVGLTAPVGRLLPDGRREVLVVSAGGDALFLNANGTLARTTPLGSGLGAARAPAVGELDGAPGEEAVVSFAGGAAVALDAQGSALPGWPATLGGGTPVLADLDRDGRHEIVAPYLGGAGSDRLTFAVRRGDAAPGPGDGAAATPPDGTSWLAVSSPAVLVDDAGVEVVVQGLYRRATSGGLDRGGVRHAVVRLRDGAVTTAVVSGLAIDGLTPTGTLFWRWLQLATPLVREAGDGPGPEPELLVSLGWEEVIAGTPNLRGGLMAWLGRGDGLPAAARWPLAGGYSQATAPSVCSAALLPTADGSGRVRIALLGNRAVAQPVGEARGDAPEWAAARGDARNAGALAVFTGGATGLPAAGAAVRRLALTPNPGPGRLAARWEGLPRGPARLEVFDLRGRRVRRLELGPVAGTGEAVWDGRAEDGRPVAAGAYLLVLRHPGGDLRARAVVTR